jgi:hypothetical protein
MTGATINSPSCLPFLFGCPPSERPIDSVCSRIETWNTSGASAMKDYLAQVEKLRKDSAECALIRDLATEPAKREMFDRLAHHLMSLADQVEMAMLDHKTGTKS